MGHNNFFILFIFFIIISLKEWDQFAGHNEIKLQLNNKSVTENLCYVGKVNPHLSIPNKYKYKIVWMNWNVTWKLEIFDTEY